MEIIVITLSIALLMFCLRCQDVFTMVVAIGLYLVLVMAVFEEKSIPRIWAHEEEVSK